MTKRIVVCLLAVLCLLLPLSVQAEELDTDRLCTLTLHYSVGGDAFDDDEMRNLLSTVKNYIPEAQLRGQN